MKKLSNKNTYLNTIALFDERCLDREVQVYKICNHGKGHLFFLCFQVSPLNNLNVKRNWKKPSLLCFSTPRRKSRSNRRPRPQLGQPISRCRAVFSRSSPFHWFGRPGSSSSSGRAASTWTCPHGQQRQILGDFAEGREFSWCFDYYYKLLPNN